LTPLHIAAEEGNVEVCKFLIEEIKNKNPKLPHNGWTPLHPACKMGYFGICEVILKNVTEKDPKLNAQKPHPFLQQKMDSYLNSTSLQIT
jgi:ankyrin repeat protein